MGLARHAFAFAGKKSSKQLLLFLLLLQCNYCNKIFITQLDGFS